MSSTKIIASIDTGGTKILVTLLDESGKILARSKKSTKSKKGKEFNIVKRLKITIDDALSNIDLTEFSLQGIVIGIPGVLNPEKGIIYMAPNLGVVNTNIVKPLTTAYNIPVFIENDANLGTLGIHSYETSAQFRNLIAIFIGTGIGAGIILNNELFRGKSFAAGEIGHMIVADNGVKCGCGQIGCFETTASRLAIEREIFEQIKNGKRSNIKKILLHEKTDQIKSGILAKALAEKDKLTEKVLTTAAENVGKMIAGISNLMNFDCYVLAGGVIEAVGSFMLPLITESAKRYALKQNIKKVKILQSKLGDDAAIFGGYVLAKQKGIF